MPTWDEDDLEEATEDEVESLEDEVVDQATAARTVAELEAEIASLKELEGLARALRRSGQVAPAPPPRFTGARDPQLRPDPA